MKKVKDETDATFLDVYDVVASKFGHFSHLSTKLKVNHAFKAKKVTFRERNPQKVKNDQNFIHLAFVFATQMKTIFLASSTPKPCANQCFYYPWIEINLFLCLLLLLALEFCVRK